MAFKAVMYSGVASLKEAIPAANDEFAECLALHDADLRGALTTALAKDYQLTDFDFKSVFKRAGASSLDFWDLIIEVAKLLPSIFETPTVNSNNKALNFMELVIYHIAPSTRQIKAGQDSDKHWNMRSYNIYTNEQLIAFGTNAMNMYNKTTTQDKWITEDNRLQHPYGIKINAMLAFWATNVVERPVASGSAVAPAIHHIAGTITCATFKSVAAPLDAPKVSANKGITLTMKQVSLVSIFILNTYTPVAVASGFIVLTPLAGAIFSRKSIDDMFEEPIIKAVYDKKEDLIIAVNSSAQSGGQHLPNSRMDIALLCAYTATSALTDDKLKRSITNKTTKQYVAAHKLYAKEFFRKMAEFATGGVPQDWAYDVIDREIQTVQTAIAARMAQKN